MDRGWNESNPNLAAFVASFRTRSPRRDWLLLTKLSFSTRTVNLVAPADGRFSWMDADVWFNCRRQLGSARPPPPSPLHPRSVFLVHSVAGCCFRLKAGGERGKGAEQQVNARRSCRGASGRVTVRGEPAPGPRAPGPPGTRGCLQPGGETSRA